MIFLSHRERDGSLGDFHRSITRRLAKRQVKANMSDYEELIWGESTGTSNIAIEGPSFISGQPGPERRAGAPRPELESPKTSLEELIQTNLEHATKLKAEEEDSQALQSETALLKEELNDQEKEFLTVLQALNLVRPRSHSSQTNLIKACIAGFVVVKVNC